MSDRAIINMSRFIIFKLDTDSFFAATDLALEKLLVELEGGSRCLGTPVCFLKRRSAWTFVMKGRSDAPREEPDGPALAYRRGFLNPWPPSSSSAVGLRIRMPLPFDATCYAGVSALIFSRSFASFRTLINFELRILSVFSGSPKEQ